MSAIKQIALRPVLILVALLAIAASAVPAAAQQPLEARAAVQLNGRAGPGLQYPIQFTMPQDAIVTILQCTEDYSWCEVAYDNQTGWASAQFLILTQSNQPMQQAGPQLGPVFQFLLGILGQQFGLPQLPTPQPQPEPEPEPTPEPPTPGTDEICFYSDTNFAGDAFCINMGASNTSLTAPWNDAISSIRVGDGATVEVCGEPNYAGWCQTYVDDVNLTGIRNDSISSYRTVNIGGAPASGPPQPPPTANVPASAITSLNARSGPGTSNPVLFVIPKDGAVEILQCLVDFSWCQLSYLGQTAWSSAQYLRSTQTGQLISQVGAQLGIPTQQPPAPPAIPTPAANQVCFYLDANFTGDNFCVAVGQTNTGITGSRNNAISSIRVGTNAKVTVCGNPDLTGWCQTYEDDVNLTSYRNNSVSSYRTLAAGGVSPSARACFYEFANYTGASFCIDAGQTYALLPAGWDNRISSITIQSGYSVQVCRDTSFGGWCELIAANVPQLTGDRDNAISSVRMQ
jgi:uncharacterized protein YraI